jgi:uncharacterized membrane protein YjjB (DUF3815 family)
VSAILWLMLLAYVQNISFSIVSRARNRDHMAYHAVAAVGSNVIWFCTFRELVTADMSWVLLVPYTIGTVAGSLTGAKVSIWFERLLGAKA